MEAQNRKDVASGGGRSFSHGVVGYRIQAPWRGSQDVSWKPARVRLLVVRRRAGAGAMCLRGYRKRKFSGHEESSIFIDRTASVGRCVECAWAARQPEAKCAVHLSCRLEMEARAGDGSGLACKSLKFPQRAAGPLASLHTQCKAHGQSLLFHACIHTSQRPSS